MDDYIELNDAQEDQFDAYFDKWMQWHRAEELPKYAAQLAEIINDVKTQNITTNRIAYHRDKARSHWVRAREYIAPDLVALGRTLDEEQLAYMFDALEQENQDDQEEIEENKALSQQEYDKKWIKRNQKNMRRWMGRLSDEQKAHIAKYKERFASTSVLWLDYKRRYQSALKEVFALPSRDAQFDAALLELVVNPEQYRGKAFNEASDSNMAAASEYLLGLYQLANDKQLKKLLSEIESLRDDVNSLQK